MTEWYALVIITAVFLLAGAVKGVVGLGLPTVSLGLLSVAFDLTTAMALLIVPSLLTNVWQACSGGNGSALIKRLWPFLLAAAAGIWLGAAALTRADLTLLSALLGALLVAYALVSLGGIRFRAERRHENWMGPVLGSANGILTGMTGSFVVPGVMYLQSLELGRDRLVQAMGMLFTVSTIALGVALERNNLLTGQLGFLSTAAVVPAVLGMIAGKRVRHCLSEERFRQLLFAAVLILGIYILFSSVFSSWGW